MINLGEGQYFGKAIQSTDRPRFKLSLTRYEGGESIEAHCHSNHYLSILTQGSYVEDNGSDSRLIQAGDIVFRPSHYVHQNLFQDRASTCFNIEFKEGWGEEIFNDFNFPTHFIKYTSVKHPGIFQILWAHNQEGDADAVLEILYHWLHHSNPMDLPSRKSLRVVQEVCVYVHPAYLARAFKKHMGLTISQHQMRVKLAQVVRQLLDTQLKLSDISFQYGFYDDAHLIRAFKRHYGISPHQFRLRIKG